MFFNIIILEIFRNIFSSATRINDIVEDQNNFLQILYFCGFHKMTDTSRKVQNAGGLKCTATLGAGFSYV